MYHLCASPVRLHHYFREYQEYVEVDSGIAFNSFQFTVHAGGWKMTECFPSREAVNIVKLSCIVYFSPTLRLDLNIVQY